MKLAFFFEGSKVINQVNSLKVKLINTVFLNLLIFVIAITALQVVLLVLRIKKLAIQITKGIVYLLESLENIIKLKRRTW